MHVRSDAVPSFMTSSWLPRRKGSERPGEALEGRLCLPPEDSTQAEEFMRTRALRILHGQVSQVVKGLRQVVASTHMNGVGPT